MLEARPVSRYYGAPPHPSADMSVLKLRVSGNPGLESGTREACAAPGREACPRTKITAATASARVEDPAWHHALSPRSRVRTRPFSPHIASA
jgi:hypothetical protein